MRFASDYPLNLIGPEVVFGVRRRKRVLLWGALLGVLIYATLTFYVGLGRELGGALVHALVGTRITYLSGPPGGVYQEVSKAIWGPEPTRDVRLGETRIRATILDTSGGIENARLIAAGRGHVGIASQDAIDVQGLKDRVQQVVRLYDSSLHVMVCKARFPMESPVTFGSADWQAAFQGAQFVTGLRESQSDRLARATVRAAQFESSKVSNVDSVSRALDMVVKSCDTEAFPAPTVAMFLMGAEAASVHNFPQLTQIRLLEVDDTLDEKIREGLHMPQLHRTPIGRSKYELPSEVSTIGLSEYLIASQDVSPHVLFTILETLSSSTYAVCEPDQCEQGPGPLHQTRKELLAAVDDYRRQRNADRWAVGAAAVANLSSLGAALILGVVVIQRLGSSLRTGRLYDKLAEARPRRPAGKPKPVEPPAGWEGTPAWAALSTDLEAVSKMYGLGDDAVTDHNQGLLLRSDVEALLEDLADEQRRIHRSIAFDVTRVAFEETTSELAARLHTTLHEWLRTGKLTHETYKELKALGEELLAEIDRRRTATSAGVP